MGLFRSRTASTDPPTPPTAGAANQLPITQVDLTKRYDVYCTAQGHDRLYEDVRFIGIRTFDRITDYNIGLVQGYLEIEAADGTTALIPTFGIQFICHHGAKPIFKVLRRRNSPDS